MGGSKASKEKENKETTKEVAAKIEVTSIHDFTPRNELIVQYVDFSTKYGIGYKLKNGSYGVLFNDSTKIVLDPNMFHFDYY